MSPSGEDRVLNYEPVELEWFRFSKHAKIGRTFLENMRAGFDLVADDIVNHEVARFVVESAMVGQRLNPEVFTESTIVEFRVPATWWQHWKADHADTRWAGWVARWRPPVMSVERRVATVTVDVARAALFPEDDRIGHMVPLGTLGTPRLHVYRDSAEWNVTPT